MGRVTYALRLIAGLMMAVAVIAAFASFSDAMDGLGKPGEAQMLGALMLAAFACFLIVLLSAGILWVLTEISEQLELTRKPAAAQTQTSLRPSTSP